MFNFHKFRSAIPNNIRYIVIKFHESIYSPTSPLKPNLNETILNVIHFKRILLNLHTTFSNLKDTKS